MKTCHIFAAGDYYYKDGFSLTKNFEDIVIACDAGLDFCLKAGITPDIVIGDFDSLGYTPEINGLKIIKLPVMKNDTDTSFAVKYAMKNGYTRFAVYGGTGGSRAEHTHANISLLSYISKNGGAGFLFFKNQIATSVTNGKISFPDYFSGELSVFSFDTASLGVTEIGLLYSLDDFTLKNSEVLGVSNSFIGKKSEVSVKNGTIIVYFSGNICDVSIDNNIYM